MVRAFYVSLWARAFSVSFACRDLNALFEELVRQSGSISEQEFWAGRQHLLRKQQGESGPQKQRAGVGNAMLLAMRPSADGKTNTVRTHCSDASRTTTQCILLSCLCKMD